MDLKCDFGDIYDELESPTLHPQALQELAPCCFKKNPYTHQYSRLMLTHMVDLDEAEIWNANLIKTHRHNLVVINHALKSLLDYFDGQTNLRSLFHQLKDDQHEFVVYAAHNMETEFHPVVSSRICVGEQSGTLAQSRAVPTSEPTGANISNPVGWQTFVIQQRFENLVSLVKTLHRTNLIDLVGFSLQVTESPPIQLKWELEEDAIEERALEPALLPAGNAPLSPVLLLGATTGPAAVGILYLASYLRRHGIEAYCRFSDPYDEYAALEQNIQQLLEKIKPKLVGVSLKWFPHIARGLEICTLVKKYAPDMRTVLGGDTASYFYEELIKNEQVDCIIRGDGELPLLKLAMGEEDIPNAVYKRNGRVIQTPVAYVHAQHNSSEVYLSHLDEILVSPADLFYAPFTFVFTGRGCPMPCFYCAGACENQRRVFNRKAPCIRSMEAARQDIARLKKHTSTFMFDFDWPSRGSIDYYRRLWEGLDLKSHFARFYFWSLPSEGFIDLVAKTFKYVYLNIDLCSLSERHRLYLDSLKVVKPQLTDEQIFSFFNVCEKYNNAEVIISSIVGMPFYTEEDIENSQKMHARLRNEYTCFEALAWEPLHAQPGAPITFDYERFNMTPGAATYKDYLGYSVANLNRKRYPGGLEVSHPVIRYKDNRLNFLVMRHYVKMVSVYLNDNRRKVRFCNTVAPESVTEAIA